jgi:hypothetical protein
MHRMASLQGREALRQLGVSNLKNKPEVPYQSRALVPLRDFAMGRLESNVTLGWGRCTTLRRLQVGSIRREWIPVCNGRADHPVHLAPTLHACLVSPVGPKASRQDA